MGEELGGSYQLDLAFQTNLWWIRVHIAPINRVSHPPETGESRCSSSSSSEVRFKHQRASRLVDSCDGRRSPQSSSPEVMTTRLAVLFKATSNAIRTYLIF